MAAMTPPVPLVLRRDEVIPEIAKLVVVALVVVLTFIVRPLMVLDAAWTVIPMVVVGTSEPPETFQSLNNELM